MEPHTRLNIIEKYFQEKNIADFQIASYNHFLHHDLKKVIEDEPVLMIRDSKQNIKYKIKFDNVHITKPTFIDKNRKKSILYPNEARMRDMTYESWIQVNIIETFENKKSIIHKRVNLAKIPMMLGCDFCNLSSLSMNERVHKAGECSKDFGGYFIVKGTERVLVSQVRNAYNRTIVTKVKNEFKSEMRSISIKTGHSVCIRIIYNEDKKTFEINIPYVKKMIPFHIFLRCYEKIFKTSIIDMVKDKLRLNKDMEYLLHMAFNEYDEMSIDECLLYIGQRISVTIDKTKLLDYVLNLLKIKLFPHLGIDPKPIEILDHIFVMFRKLLYCISKKRQLDERDSYSNKRVETSGILVCELFAILFKKFLSNAKNYLGKKKNKNNIKYVIQNDAKSITTQLHTAFATGNWGAQKNSYIRTGVSQVLSRLTYTSMISHFRRLMVPIGKEGKNVELRKIHTSQFGYICSTETPEGQPSGTVLNFALLMDVTFFIDSLLVEEVITPLVDTDYSELDKTMVFLNGKIIGSVNDHKKFIKTFKELQYNEHIHPHVSVNYYEIDNEINIWCDKGRCIRPVLTLSNDKKRILMTNQEAKTLSWKSMIEKKYIKYIDVETSEHSVIAMKPDMLSNQQNNYCEIHPCVQLGIMALLIPFPHHNPSPRNVYQCSMQKQSIGIPMLSHNLRADTSTHILHYNQKPLVNTKMAHYLGLNEIPAGMNVVVAIATYTGYNQEDSIIFNKGSIEKGLFVCTTKRSIEAVEKKINQSSREIIQLPPVNNVTVSSEHPSYFRRKYGRYDKLDEDGIIKPYTITIENGREKRIPTYIQQGDVVVGKIVHIRNKSGSVVRQDNSVIANKNEEGFIDRIFIDKTLDGHKIVKIIVRKLRVPEIGDKFASRSAQKGVIGMIFNQEDMPFNVQTGIVPDIIINPHAIPSRMTMNQLMECILGKKCCLDGTYGDATAFTNDNSITNIYSELEKVGLQELKRGGFSYAKTGCEELRNGFTGKKMNAKIFMGPTYYQRLKHMVSDKIYGRTRGSVTTFMRQPVEGRSRDGGLKFGEMERDAMISHGTSIFLREKLFNCSDKFQIYICSTCGQFTTSTKYCTFCNHNKIKKCDLPYAAKVLSHELMAMTFKMNYVV